MMHETLTVPALGLGAPTACEGSVSHYPKITRLVWHHILPQVCGGLTSLDNLVGLCDNCHYTVHALMFAMKMNGIVPKKGTRKQRALAVQGFDSAVAVGTSEKIPNEGGTLA